MKKKKNIPLEDYSNEHCLLSLNSDCIHTWPVWALKNKTWMENQKYMYMYTYLFFQYENTLLK